MEIYIFLNPCSVAAFSLFSKFGVLGRNVSEGNGDVLDLVCVLKRANSWWFIQVKNHDKMFSQQNRTVSKACFWHL